MIRAFCIFFVMLCVFDQKVLGGTWRKPKGRETAPAKLVFFVFWVFDLFF